MRNFLRFMLILLVFVVVFLLSGLLFYGQCDAQMADPQKSLSITKFKGLMTAGGPFNTPPDFGVIDNNVDHSRFGVNTIGKRKGFDSVKVVTQCDSSGTIVSARIDSIVGLGTYQRSNRQSCLVYAVDDSTKGYGAIYATKYGSDNPDSATKIKDYWSIQNPTRFSQFNDNLYATNGQQQGMVWNGTRTMKFPVSTPGMFDIIPINTSGNLNGEYRYCIHSIQVYSGVSGYAISAGTISPPVYVKNGQVLLRSFTRVITDSIITSVDSAYALIGRTKANPGSLDELDSIYRVSATKVWLKYGSNHSADTVTFTDNATDASLSGAPVFSLKELGLAYGRDSTKALADRRYGAPTFIRADSVTSGSNVIYPGSQTGAQNILGYAYAVTVADTTIGLESDTSRSMWVRTRRIVNAADSTKTLHRITIGLPRVGVRDSGCVFNVYRASLMVFGRKYVAIINGDTVWAAPPSLNILNPYDRAIIFGKRGLRIDSLIALDWYRCAQIPTSQDTLVDSIRTDSLYFRAQRFNLSTQPEIFSQTFQWRSKLGGVAGSRIWFSSQFVDSQGNFGTNDFDDFSRTDGDFITAISEKQFGLVVKKNRSSYVLPNNGGRPEKTKGTGCVAPLSYVSTDVGDLYVGDGGVYLETEGDALEKVYNSGLVSEALNNFIDMPDSVRRRISGFWLPQSRQAILSADYPATANDTAFVLDFRAGQAWSTWTNLVPRFGCLYSKNSTIGSPPPQTFYYTKAGGKTIYTYGTSDYDANSQVMAPITYQTPPLFPDARYQHIDQVGIIGSGFLTAADSVSAIVYDEHGGNASSTLVFDSLAYIEGTSNAVSGLVYRYLESNAPEARAPYVKFFTGSNSRNLIRGGIHQIEILYRDTQRKRVR